MSLSPLESKIENIIDSHFSSWNVPETIKGKILDGISGLTKELSFSGYREDDYQILVKNKHKNGSYSGYDIYAIKEKSTQLVPRIYVAYGCPKCEKIIVDMPKIETETSTGISSATDRGSYSVFCGNCNAKIDEYVHKMSLH